MSDYEELADRLDGVVADLDELAFDLLRAAVADGAVERTAADKRLVQARRAAERAAHLLRAISDGE